MFFIVCWREQTPLGHQVTSLPGVTVLDWFRAGWEQPDPETWAVGQLGDVPYGLESIFERAREFDLPPPSSVDELRALLAEHLWVESDDDPRVGEHSVRVRTNDDETDLAYYFVDDQAVGDEEWTFLRSEGWPLPAGTSGGSFAFDVPVQAVGPVVVGGEAVFSVRATYEHRDPGMDDAVVFPGVTLPGFTAYLDGITDAEAVGWPHDALFLRALAAPGEPDLGPALARFVQAGGYDPVPWRIEAAVDRAAAFEKLAPIDERWRHDRSLIQQDPHIVQVARYIDDFWGYDQWFIFDTRWAAAHPELARSLLRWASHWDPYEHSPGRH